MLQLPFSSFLLLTEWKLVPLTLINVFSAEALQTMMSKVLKLNTAKSFEG